MVNENQKFNEDVNIVSEYISPIQRVEETNKIIRDVKHQKEKVLIQERRM